jgi:hypothetical protein
MRSAAAFLGLVWLAAAGCVRGAGSPDPSLPPKPKPLIDRDRDWKLTRDLDKSFVEGKAKEIEDYARGLQLFVSNDPKVHEEAFRIIDGHPNLEVVPLVPGAKYETFESFPDRELIRIARGADPAKAPAARRELGRRGALVVNCLVFTKPFDLRYWNAAKGELLQLGDAGRINMGMALAGALLDPSRRRDWPHVRVFLAELEEIGFQIVKAVFEEYLRPSLPHDSIPIYLHMERVTEYFMAMIQLSGYARPYLLDLAKQRGVWQRRCIASAIGKSREVAMVDVLREYAGDPNETVRATAYEALGRLAIAGPEPSRILVEALAKETDEMGLEMIARGLEQLGSRDAVPKLVEIVDHPEYPVVRVIMRALRSLTGARGPQTPAEWKAWWERNKTRWQ